MTGTILIHLLWLADGGRFILLIPFCSEVTITAFIPPCGTFSVQINREFMHRSLQRLPFFYHVINNPQSAPKWFHPIPPPLCSAATMYSGYSVYAQPFQQLPLPLQMKVILVSPASTKGSLNSPRAWPLFVPNQRAHFYPSTTARSCWISIIDCPSSTSWFKIQHRRWAVRPPGIQSMVSMLTGRPCLRPQVQHVSWLTLPLISWWMQHQQSAGSTRKVSSVALRWTNRWTALRLTPQIGRVVLECFWLALRPYWAATELVLLVLSACILHTNKSFIALSSTLWTARFPANQLLRPLRCFSGPITRLPACVRENSSSHMCDCGASWVT